MTFQGFTQETIRFLNDLKANNKREWFEKHKPIYKEYVEGLAKAFQKDMSERLSDLTNERMGSRLFRIYRDVRFSKDKTPYNPYIHISFFCESESGKPASQACGAKPAFLFAFETDRFITGAGSFGFPKEVLESYHRAVLEDSSGKALAKILSNYQKQKNFRLHDPSLKRVPAGYDKEHPRAELLRYKEMAGFHDDDFCPELFSDQAIEMLFNKFQNYMPLYNWLADL